jgi:hypothetical protein
MINSEISALTGGLHNPNQATTTTDCCSFEMIRASFQQEWASQGFYVIHGHKAPKASGVLSKDY